MNLNLRHEKECKYDAISCRKSGRPAANNRYLFSGRCGTCRNRHFTGPGLVHDIMLQAADINRIVDHGPAASSKIITAKYFLTKLLDNSPKTIL